MYWFMVIFLAVGYSVLRWFGASEDSIQTSLMIVCIAAIAEFEDKWKATQRSIRAA